MIAATRHRERHLLIHRILFSCTRVILWYGSRIKPKTRTGRIESHFPESWGFTPLALLCSPVQSRRRISRLLIIRYQRRTDDTITPTIFPPAIRHGVVEWQIEEESRF